jgi:hypothetical protein
MKKIIFNIIERREAVDDDGSDTEEYTQVDDSGSSIP